MMRQYKIYPEIMVKFDLIFDRYNDIFYLVGKLN